MNLKYLAILVFLCCFIGAASASEDVSTDVASSELATADSVSLGTNNDMSTELTASSDDATQEIANEETKTVENELNINNEFIRGTQTNASNWSDLKLGCENNSDMFITLNGTAYAPTIGITFNNNATIIGTENSYITDGSFHEIPFINSNPDLTITFINVKFRNMNVENLLQLAGTSIFENCSFDNIKAAAGHNSVLYNTDGIMNLTGCNITNCSAGYGVVSNYKPGSVTDVIMNVDHCKFINNSANVEPGGINNCGILSVNNSEFTNNSASWWAGAIHTHSNAQTFINNTNFTGNVAGWNGGALYTYSKLMVYNSIFKENKCRTSAGGGAIGSSNWGSAYNITISNCTFEENANLCGNTNETPSTGTGGAISAMNNGILNVYDSTFIHNVAKTGQAIAAYSQGYVSHEGNITEGIPKVIISNNTFINHTLTSSDTVQLSGDYTFSNNTFNNCYQINPGINNTFNNPVNLNNVILSDESFEFADNLKSAYKNVLKEDPPIEERNASSWEELFWAYNEIGNNGIIHVLDGNHWYNFDNQARNITFIGQSKNAVFDSLVTMVTSMKEPNTFFTFINFTINSANLTINSMFINCTFINTISIASGIDEIRWIEETPFGVTYTMSFNNCEFKDINTESSLITLYKYGRVFLNNCSFYNITADSIVGKDGGFIDQDGIYIYNCSFTNCNVKGVVDIPGDIEIAEYCAIEDCDYDFNATTDIEIVDEHAHNYLNATKLKAIAVDSVIDISSQEDGTVVICLTDNASVPIAGATISYTVNDEGEIYVNTNEEGKVFIDGLIGEVTVAVNYPGNDSFNPVSASKSFIFADEPAINTTNGTNATPDVPVKVATKLSAANVIATYNVAKKLVITLVDKDGKRLAGRKVTIKVGSISKILTTDKNGKVSINVASLAPKTYTATVKFAGDSDYKPSSLSSKVVVNKAKVKIAVKSKTFKLKAKVKKLNVVLKNNKGKALKRTNLSLKVGKKTYKVKTNKKGVATFKLKLSKKGKYAATIKFAGNKYFKPLSKKIKIKVT